MKQLIKVGILYSALAFGGAYAQESQNPENKEESSAKTYEQKSVPSIDDILGKTEKNIKQGKQKLEELAKKLDIKLEQKSDYNQSDVNYKKEETEAEIEKAQKSLLETLKRFYDWIIEYQERNKKDGIIDPRLTDPKDNRPIEI